MNVTFKQTGIYSPSQIKTNQQNRSTKPIPTNQRIKKKFQRTWISMPKKKQDLSN